MTRRSAMRRPVSRQAVGILTGSLLGGSLWVFLVPGRQERGEVARFWTEAWQRSGRNSRGPVADGLWEALGWRVLAQQSTIRERERLEAWDPDALAGAQWEPWRLQAMGRDPQGYLQRARAVLIRTAAAARSRHERARVATLRAL